MADREVGTLWIGGQLSWLEQLSLKSFVDKGQKITLFHYGDVSGVPEGVIQRDGREVIDTDNFLKYERKDSFALFADWFRLHMIAKNPGMIWIDADVYCWRPMQYDFDDIYGLELPNRNRVNNAVMGFHPDSPVLRDMIELTSDQYAIPPFYPAKERAELETLAAAGTPQHVSKMRWGVWGPMMLSYYVARHGGVRKAQPIDAFYPIVFPERRAFLKAPKVAKRAITENTTALHLWASNKLPMGYRHKGLPPDGSFYAELCRLHKIDATLAPIQSRGVHKFDTDNEDED